MSVLSGFGRLLRGHPVLLDAAVAALLYAGMMAVAIHAPATSPWHLQPGLAVLAAVACGASVLRRERPVLALLIPVAVIVVSPLLGVNHNVLPLALVIPLINVFLRAERRTALAVGGVAVAVISVAAAGNALAHRIHFETTPPGFNILVIGVMCIAIGDARRNRRDYVREVEERARRAEHGREQEARRRVAEERLRISRDLHDILAHHIALITVQAGAAAHVLDRQPHRAREALEHIRAAGSLALSDLHQTITVLRTGEDGPATTEPAAGLDRLSDLLESFEQAGLTVETEIRGEPRRLPATTDIAAYRVIQESLTNVRKHAGPVLARLLLEYQPKQIAVLVENRDCAAVTSSAGTGHGLLGMRERAQMLGGTLVAGPLPGGGFRVSARIPSADVPSPDMTFA